MHAARVTRLIEYGSDWRSLQVDLKINTKVGGVKRRGGGGGFGEGYRWVPSPCPTRPFHSEITLACHTLLVQSDALVLLTVLMVLAVLLPLGSE